VHPKSPTPLTQAGRTSLEIFDSQIPMTIPHPAYHAFARCYPLALFAALASLFWMECQQHLSNARCLNLRQIFTGLVQSRRDEARQAFAAGDFPRALEMINSASAGVADDPEFLTLRARSLECLGHFQQAAQVYARLELLPGRHLAADRGRKFCERMAGEGAPKGGPSREALYRLHGELMDRGDAACARYVALRLLPDFQPLRSSTLALLRAWDSGAQLSASEEPGLTDITLTHWQPSMVDLLRNFPIGVLDLSQARMENIHALAGLDIRSLNLSGCTAADLFVLRSLPLRELRLDHVPVVEVNPLAGMPLRELHLSHTSVTSLVPLGLCPIQKLDLSSTAVVNLAPLRGMELRDLDLSHTRVTDISSLAGLPLERLVLNNTSVVDLRALHGLQLKSLSLANTPVKHLEALAGMPLVELDLRGCELLTNLAPLASCPQLESLHLPGHLKLPADCWQLPRLKFVDYDHQALPAHHAIAKK
jgi:hypothetical protein